GNDRKLAKYWEATRRSGEKYSKPLINVNNVNNSISVSGGGTIGSINSGVNNNKTFSSRKRYQEEYDSNEVASKRKRQNAGDGNTINSTESVEIIDDSESETEPIDIDQDEEEIRRLTQVFILFAVF
ncbi:13194_t:CDS:2, partial [Acaulospora morrowiae]